MKDDAVTTAYCIASLIVSWSLQYSALDIVGDPQSASAVPWLLVTMATPGLLAIAFLVAWPATRHNVLWKPNWRFVYVAPIAVLVPTAIAFATLTAAAVAGWGGSKWFDFALSGVQITGGPWVLGQGVQGWPLFTSNVIITGSFFALLNAIPALGEELGWRGFLQTRLIERFGVLKGITMLGLIWSAWHLPAQAAGYNFPDSPLIGSFVLSPIELVFTSYFLAWLTIRSGSFIAAAVAHGAGNSIQEGVIASLHLTVSPMHVHLLRVMITVIVGVLCLALLLPTRRH